MCFLDSTHRALGPEIPVMGIGGRRPTRHSLYSCSCVDCLLCMYISTCSSPFSFPCFFSFARQPRILYPSFLSPSVIYTELLDADFYLQHCFIGHGDSTEYKSWAGYIDSRLHSVTSSVTYVYTSAGEEGPGSSQVILIPGRV